MTHQVPKNPSFSSILLPGPAPDRERRLLVLALAGAAILHLGLILVPLF